MAGSAQLLLFTMETSLEDHSREKTARVFFNLTPNYLYVANDGYPFDREGVLAICMANLSSKSDDIEDIHSSVPDSDWIQENNLSKLQIYQIDPNLVQANAKDENSTVRDYSGRGYLKFYKMQTMQFVKETCENISEQRDWFFICFEMVCEPEIYSGPFHFSSK